MYKREDKLLVSGEVGIVTRVHYSPASSQNVYELRFADKTTSWVLESHIAAKVG